MKTEKRIDKHITIFVDGVKLFVRNWDMEIIPKSSIEEKEPNDSKDEPNS